MPIYTEDKWIMPTYYFDMFDSHVSSRDDDGSFCDDTESAADQAAAILADVALHQIERRGRQDFAIAVRGEDDRDVYRAAVIFRETFPGRFPPPDSPHAGPAKVIADPLDLIRRSRETRMAAEGIVRRVDDAKAALAETMRLTIAGLRLARSLTTQPR